MVSVGVKQIRFLDGAVADIPPAGLTAIVGPNNGGKSVLLGEIAQSLERGSPFAPASWVSGVELERTGSPAELEEWFRLRARLAPDGEAYGGQLVIGDAMQGPRLTLNKCLLYWQGANGLGPLASHFAGYHDAMSRANLLQIAEARNPMISARSPLHRVWDDRELEAHLARLTKRALGFDVSLNRYAQQLELLMGKPTRPDETLPPSAALLEEYARLSVVRDQGDGIRSFVGLLLAFLASGNCITMIDDPEVFLHPPQARSLGRYLAQESPPTTTQVLIATHSEDLLEGVLEGAADREVTIIRISGTGTSGTRKKNALPAERVKAVWTDPLLRYSRLLDGLFHQGVVICEADVDCRLYEAALDARLGARAEHDLVFTHVGGKDRLPLALAELNRLALPAAVIAGLDVLDDQHLVAALVEAGGGEPASVLDDLPGDASAAAERVLGHLRSLGIFLVPGGALKRRGQRPSPDLATLRDLAAHFGIVAD